MPWNEPGGGKDPWGQRPSDQQGPPDLDEVLRKLTERLGNLFGGKGIRGGGRGRGGKGGAPGPSLWLLLVAALLVWLGSGIYIIDPGEAGVVLRFGAYARTAGPGPHWHAPYPIESVERVNVTEIRTAQHKATMLTQDENIVEVEVAAQYLIEQPEDYLFQVRLPDVTLRQVMESALREVVGRSKMDYILAEGRAEVAAKTRELMQAILKEYKTGLLVTALNMQQAQPPAAVQDAFADAIKAREDEARFRNEAQAYANGILPQARGEAARLKQEAIAYRDSITENAQGEADRFVKLLQAYRQAPAVTRERLYLETVEQVLSGSNKVLVDVAQGNNLFYVPLEQLMKQPKPLHLPETGAAASPTGGTFSRRAASNSGSASERVRRPMRLREGR